MVSIVENPTRFKSQISLSYCFLESPPTLSLVLSPLSPLFISCQSFIFPSSLTAKPKPIFPTHAPMIPLCENHYLSLNHLIKLSMPLLSLSLSSGDSALPSHFPSLPCSCLIHTKQSNYLAPAQAYLTSDQPLDRQNLITLFTATSNNDDLVSFVCCVFTLTVRVVDEIDGEVMKEVESIPRCHSPCCYHEP
jgi:hypothetical protein